jgi:hypothetical protein
MQIEPLPANYACPNNCENGTSLMILTRLVEKGYLIFEYVLNDIQNTNMSNGTNSHTRLLDDRRVRRSQHRRTRRVRTYARSDTEVEETTSTDSTDVVDTTELETSDQDTGETSSWMPIYDTMLHDSKPRYPTFFSIDNKQDADNAIKLIKQEAGFSFENRIPSREVNLITGSLSNVLQQDLIASFRQTLAGISDSGILQAMQRRDLGRVAHELLRKRKTPMSEIVRLLEYKKSNIYNVINWYKLLKQVPECVFISQSWTKITQHLTGEGKIDDFKQAFDHYQQQHGHKFGFESSE